MGVSRTLPVLMPPIPRQRWSCHSCGACCRTLVGHLTESERKRIDDQQWSEELGAAPYVRAGRTWALNKREGGACVFLDADNRCLIHARYGEQAKPFACRIFPFSVRPIAEGWQASFRFDCPSAVSSQGEPIDSHRAALSQLVRQLDHERPAKGDQADLVRGIRATSEESDELLRRLQRWIEDAGRPMVDRLIAAADLTRTLHGSKLKSVRGPRFTELLDLLFKALPGESAEPAESPTPKQRGMLRQLVFAHIEHVSLAQLRSGVWAGLWKRWRQLGDARRFLKGHGIVPSRAASTGTCSFDDVEQVAPAIEGTNDIEELLGRYLSARLGGRSVFGAGYYGWSVFPGLTALWLSVAVAGWLARLSAAAAGRPTIQFDDVGGALGLVDRAATRLPALGTLTERGRIAFLLEDHGVARLICAYRLTGSKK